MVTLWPVPFPTFWVGLTVLLAGGLAVLLPAARREVCYLGATLALMLAGICAQYVLLVLSDSKGPEILPGYMAFNAPRVLALPTVLVWLLGLLPAGMALARQPAREPTRQPPDAEPTRQRPDEEPTRQPAEEPARR